MQSKWMVLAAGSLGAMVTVATLPAIAQNVAQVGQLPEEANTPEIPQVASCDAGEAVVEPSEATNEVAAVQYVAEVCVVEVPPGTEVGTELSTQLGTETL